MLLHDAERDHMRGKTFPNFALMKISAFHKARADTVEWCNALYNADYGAVYSTVGRVKRTAKKAKGTTEKTVKFAVRHWKGLAIFGACEKNVHFPHHGAAVGLLRKQRGLDERDAIRAFVELWDMGQQHGVGEHYLQALYENHMGICSHSRMHPR